ncbi:MULTISPECIES: DUF485 domain-containing protein [Rhodococcus]|uniref:DUF485 domain-containing protein n=1 Tax=Rhodococcus oxybenzonivorans TaxID=1990687 RepID=A0AAE5A9M2_9NOCA|nr:MULTISPECIES: DUF485 domain-containing protein [Rhodococcus]MDV7241460.1 DUF485 domain-containing protein [Rhodococcus oxybenzonivorans]MDV7268656.1 DUF485 domain-containing protein [Rhodococcus oxybenzonivorans]MDV7274007.1 DUF485 domain-containing protein [Rhodococcus oxybenzonivorans]MDV7333741.1 DUF485 domain-containing protein [Rhodococcus oxybenzonivorans]MDV7343160.1 DUF485 domain-containing protein [Rhodococcus oxybenzonivorans]
MTTDASLTESGAAIWSPILALPEFVELRRRRRAVTASLGVVAVGLFTGFLVGFAFFPEVLGGTALSGIPLSLWVVFSQFAGTWLLVYAYFRLSRTYIQPAADAAVLAIELRQQERAA